MYEVTLLYVHAFSSTRLPKYMSPQAQPTNHSPLITHHQLPAFLLALVFLVASAGLPGVVHGSRAAQFLVTHFQHIQAGEGTVGFVYTGDGEDEIGVICKFSCAFF